MIACSILLAGSARLAFDRQWDRLALIAGLVASLAGFRILGGPNCLASLRYGLFAAMPIAVGLACSISALRITPTSPIRRLGSGLQHIGIGAFGVILLSFAWSNDFQPFVAARLDSPWTLRVDREDSFTTAASLMLEDSRKGSNLAPVAVYADTEWVAWPLMYLTGPKPAFEFSKEWSWAHGPAAIRSFVDQTLRSGGYAVGAGGGPIAGAVESLYRPQLVRRWDFKLGPMRRLVLYRLNRAGESSVDPIVFQVKPVGEDVLIR